MKDRGRMLIRAIWQMAWITTAACILAACVNLWRGNGIPLVGDWSEDSRFTDASGQSLVISLKDASLKYAENDAVFVDARPENEYAEGHIERALSLPWHEVNERFMEVAPDLEGGKTIICYCDGESCELSHDLALFLSDMGFEETRVLVNGWTKWRQAGLPIQTEGHGNE